MRYLYLLLSVMLLSLCAQAQKAQPIPLWAGEPPVPNGLQGPETLREDGYFVMNISQAQLYVYLPTDKATSRRMAVVICPGGGYGGLAIDHEGHEYAQWLAEQGVAGVVLKYRMPNGHHRVPLSDAREALRYVRSQATAWGLDGDKIGISGFSAGGHLASTALTHLVDDAEGKANFGVLFYPVISMQDGVAHQGSKRNLLGTEPSAQQVADYSNAARVTAATPPTLLLLSDDDKSVSPANSVEFYQALKAHKVPAAMYIFPIGGHGWGMRSSFKYQPQVRQLVKEWLYDLYQ